MAKSNIKGVNIHRNRLRRMHSKYMQDEVIKTIYAGGEAVRADAQASIREGAISGPGHVPSAPGEPPNADTHELDMSIDVRMSATRKSVIVTAEAPYSAALEFGTSTIVERPFMRPALRRNRNRLVAGVAKTVSDVSKGIRVFKDSTASIDAAAEYIKNQGK